MSQNYTIDNFSLSELNQPKKIQIPSYQRGIVWSKEHRKEFITTVKEGDPFGVILVSQETKQDPCIVIDGLQRLSTLKAYMDNPLEFIDENDKFIDQEKKDDLFVRKYKSLLLPLPKENKLDKEKKAFLKQMIEIMKQKPVIPTSEEMWDNLGLYKILGLLSPNDFSVYNAFASFYKAFCDNLKLPDIKIHAIVYTGPNDRLPIVFERLNTTAVTLSKYEVFSSKWPQQLCAVNDSSIIDNVWKKYQKLKDSSSFEVETTKESLVDNGITLFEYCIAMSEMLNDESASFSFLFPKEKKSTSPLGFELLSIACGLPVNKADALYKKEYLGGSISGKFLIDLKNAIIESVQNVAAILKPWVHDIQGSAIKNSSTYQIYNMIGKVFFHSFELNLNTKEVLRKDNSKWMDKFRKYAHKWYLYQRITNFWNLHRQVSELKSFIDDYDSDEYVTDISRKQWESSLSEFVEKSNDSPIGKKRAIPEDLKLVLNYYYKLLISEDKNRIKYFEKKDIDDKEVFFDIEHIVPVAKFDKTKQVAFTVLGNLCYLPVRDNRSKRDKTIYEYAADRPALVSNSEFLELVIYPSKKELEFINYGAADFIPAYNTFIESRSTKILARFLDLIMS